MSSVDELVSWLREQVAAVRQTACDAIVRKTGGDEWGVGEDRIPNWRTDEQDTEVIGGGKPIVQCNYEYGGPLIAAHIAEHDPAAVIAMCDAHTTILDRLQKLGSGNDSHRGLLYATRAIALGYRHRPGYREEWKP